MLVYALHTLAVITPLKVVGKWCSYYSILQPFMSVCHLYMQISKEPNCARKLWKIDRTTESISINVYFDLSCKCYLTVPETASSDTGIMFSATAAANDSSNSLLFLKPPPGSEIPRSASVSSALPRPRPQVDGDLQTGSYEEL